MFNNLQVFFLIHTEEQSVLQLAFLPRINLPLQLPVITYLGGVLESEEKMKKPGEGVVVLGSFGNPSVLTSSS